MGISYCHPNQTERLIATGQVTVIAVSLIVRSTGSGRFDEWNTYLLNSFEDGGFLFIEDCCSTSQLLLYFSSKAPIISTNGLIVSFGLHDKLGNSDFCIIIKK